MSQSAQMTVPATDPLVHQLVETDETFRQLYEEHQACKQRLSEMRQQTLPSEDDEIEMKRIKLHKLSLKDQMEAIRRQHAHAVTH